jgi:hypothetical protein
MPQIIFENIREAQGKIIQAATDEIILCTERLAATRLRSAEAQARPEELKAMARRLTGERQIALVAFDQTALAKIDKAIKALPSLREENDRVLVDCKVIIEGLDAKVEVAKFRKVNAQRVIARIDLCEHIPEFNGLVSRLAEMLPVMAPLAAVGNSPEFFACIPDLLCELQPFTDSDLLNVDRKNISHTFLFNKQQLFRKA